MKITITPSDPDNSLQHSVTVESSRDALTAEEMLELFRYAMAGMGYTEKTMDQVLPIQTETLTNEQNIPHELETGSHR